MKFCPNDDCPFAEAHGDRATFADHVPNCLDCGAPLQAGDPTPAPAKARREARLVPFVECQDAMSANGVVALLQHEGIPVFLGEKFLEPPVPQLPQGASYKLQVREPDVETARALLEEPAEEELAEVPDFDAEDERERCPKCGGTAIEARTRKRSGLSAFFMGKDEDYRFCTTCNEEI